MKHVNWKWLYPLHSWSWHRLASYDTTKLNHIVRRDCGTAKKLRQNCAKQMAFWAISFFLFLFIMYNLQKSATRVRLPHTF